MANDLLSGMIWSDTLPSWQRDYYSKLMLETLRTKSIMVPFCACEARLRRRQFRRGGLHGSVRHRTELEPPVRTGHLVERCPPRQPDRPYQPGDPRRHAEVLGLNVVGPFHSDVVVKYRYMLETLCILFH